MVPTPTSARMQGLLQLVPRLRVDLAPGAHRAQVAGRTGRGPCPAAPGRWRARPAGTGRRPGVGGRDRPRHARPAGGGRGRLCAAGQLESVAARWPPPPAGTGLLAPQDPEPQAEGHAGADDQERHRYGQPDQHLGPGATTAPDRASLPRPFGRTTHGCQPRADARPPRHDRGPSQRPSIDPPRHGAAPDGAKIGRTARPREDSRAPPSAGRLRLALAGDPRTAVERPALGTNRPSAPRVDPYRPGGPRRSGSPVG